MGTSTSWKGNPDNDCEILVLANHNLNYPVQIERRLKNLGLKVDVVFPIKDVPLDEVLINFSSRGCLYAIVVTNEHVQHNRITVNILKGQPTAEHHNIRVDDGIHLIARDFGKEKARRAEQKSLLTGEKAKPVDVMKGNQAPPQLKEPPTTDFYAIVDSLKNIPLTVLQYDYLLNVLKEHRELQMEVELGSAAIVSEPVPTIELQAKILNICILNNM